MKNLIRLLIYTVILHLNAAAYAQSESSIVVVANIDEENVTLSKRQVRNLFMGGHIGRDLTVVELSHANKTRLHFDIKIVGLTQARIQSYWAQMRFSGRKKPPKQLESEQEIISFLQNNVGSVTYLPSTTELPKGLKILYTSE
jgi:hypothetical protein